eukprot:6490677-Amphidinium_carterae.2
MAFFQAKAMLQTVFEGLSGSLLLSKITQPIQKSSKPSKSEAEIKSGYDFINKQGPVESAQNQSLIWAESPLAMMLSEFYTRELDLGVGFAPSFKTASNVDYLKSEGGMMHVPAILDDAHLPSVGFEAMRSLIC